MRFVRARRFTRILAVAAMACACLQARPAPAQEMLEYQVKAAFLYNFTKFVSWPKDNFAAADAPIVLCLVGRNPFDGGLRDMLRDRKAQGRALTLLSDEEAGDFQACNVVFIPRAEDDQLARILQNTTGRGVLTVGESQAFAKAGGMIRLLLEEKKVRFDVNTARAAAERLKISSQLLKLARNVSQ
jgi:hypothetical protein